MNQAVQGCYDFRWSDIISGKNILHLWGIVVLLGVIAVSPGSSIVANSLDVMDRQRDQKRPAPLSQPKIQITEEGIPTDPTDGAQLTLRSLQISLRRALQNVIDEHNKDGWRVHQILPHSTRNIFMMILSFLVLVVTLGIWTFGASTSFASKGKNRFAL